MPTSVAPGTFSRAASLILSAMPPVSGVGADDDVEAAIAYAPPPSDSRTADATAAVFFREVNMPGASAPRLRPAGDEAEPFLRAVGGRSAHPPGAVGRDAGEGGALPLEVR